MELVVACPAIELVVPVAALQRIVAIVAVDGVIAPEAVVVVVGLVRPRRLAIFTPNCLEIALAACEELSLPISPR